MPSAAGSPFATARPTSLAWPTDRAAYGRLCRLLTAGNRRATKGECHLDLSDLLEWGEGMMLGVRAGPRPRRSSARTTPLASVCRDAFPGQRPPDGEPSRYGAGRPSAGWRRLRAHRRALRTSR